MRTKESLQSKIMNYGSLTFSEGTLNLEHLLSKAHDLIRSYNLSEGFELADEIKELLQFEGDSAVTASYYGEVEITDEERAAYLWEEVFDFLDSLSPAGFYFGAHEGDAACFGWWRAEDAV